MSDAIQAMPGERGSIPSRAAIPVSSNGTKIRSPAAALSASPTGMPNRGCTVVARPMSLEFAELPGHQESKPSRSDRGAAPSWPLHPDRYDSKIVKTTTSLELEDELLELALAQREALARLLVLFLGANGVRRLGIRAR